MRRKSKLVVCGLTAWLAVRVWAQDLSPRAYVITPNHSNAAVLTYSYFNGGIDLNGAIPISGVTVTGIFSVPSFSYYHSFGIYGHSANVTLSLPYGVGNFHGEAGQRSRSAYRSGLMDVVTRVSVNLIGGPALPLRDFVKWRQKVLLGASLKMVAPAGQYSSQKLINWGINRWAFKPELGYSERWGNWIVDAYAGGWFYTANPAYFGRPVPKRQTEEPIGSFEGHLSRNFGPGTWASIDGNFWWGGV
ncbi:MAG: transporter, partial [Acidobacteriaceae bacterium]|nr:transporter [Acidobacteriaceae bacterium]